MRESVIAQGSAFRRSEKRRCGQQSSWYAMLGFTRCESNSPLRKNSLNPPEMAILHDLPLPRIIPVAPETLAERQSAAELSDSRITQWARNRQWFLTWRLPVSKVVCSSNCRTNADRPRTQPRDHSRIPPQKRRGVVAARGAASRRKRRHECRRGHARFILRISFEAPPVATAPGLPDQ